MDEEVVRDIMEDRLTTAMLAELSELVDEGLLMMGITEDGEAVYWPTERGVIELGMEPSEEVPA